MGRKPKAGGAEDKRTDPEQSARFLEAARRAGVDETSGAFERAFEKVARPQRVSQDDQGDPEQRRKSRTKD